MSSLENLVSRLRRRKLVGSEAVALETALLLRSVVSQAKWTHIEGLLSQVRAVGRRLERAQMREFSAGNVVRRVLKLIREEYADELAALEAGRQQQPRRRRVAKSESDENDESGDDAEDASVDSDLTDHEDDDEYVRGITMGTAALSFDPTSAIHSSILNLLGRPETSRQPSSSAICTDSHLQTPDSFGKAVGKEASRASIGTDLKPALIAAIQLVIDEVRKGHADVAAHAGEYVHGGEVVMTHGAHPLAIAFLRHAAEKRQYTCILTESSPAGLSATHAAAEALANVVPPHGSGQRTGDTQQKGAQVVIAPDAAVYALMSRCNKVVLAAQAVLQNGGLLLSPGARNVCLAAKALSVPVVVLAASYDLAPIYPYGVATASIASMSESADLEGLRSSTVDNRIDAELIELNDPETILPLSFAGTLNGGPRNYSIEEAGMIGTEVDALNPASEYVGPEFVDLYLTNLGGHAPAALVRVMMDNYDEEDREL
ncbi:GCD complex subunit gcd7 [Savitreella phatthalungensis]